MPPPPTGPEIAQLIALLAKLPGLGPRSAQRASLHLLTHNERLMQPLITALSEAASKVSDCSQCGCFDTQDPCVLCCDPRRNHACLCVVEQVGDAWALEKSGAYSGLYHVLGGILSALDGVGPEELNIAALLGRARQLPENGEVILAMGATLDGQTTAHYLNDALTEIGIKVTRLAHGVPVGGELDHLDDGTILAALSARRNM